MKRTGILLADDHTLTLEGIRAVLEPCYEIVGMVSDGRALIETALCLRPDVIVLDITMPLLNGVSAAIQIKKSLPRTKLLFLTMHANPAYLEAALDAGGTGYVLKSAAREELLEALNAVLNGRIYVTPSFGRALGTVPGSFPRCGGSSPQHEGAGGFAIDRRGSAGQGNCSHSEYFRKDGRISSRKHQKKTRATHDGRIDRVRHRTRPESPLFGTVDRAQARPSSGALIPSPYIPSGPDPLVLHPVSSGRGFAYLWSCGNSHRARPLSCRAPHNGSCLQEQPSGRNHYPGRGAL
jgi:CheY-like chemotaxis protein